MQIVIDIPNSMYNLILHSDRNSFANGVSKEHMMYAIKNGTPLPKGHGRLIDADRLKSMYSINQANFNTVVGIQKWIENAPTILEADKEE